MKHFTRIADLGPEGVQQLLAVAAGWKRAKPGAIFADRILGMVFFNPSLRTRASFEAAMLRHGGHAIVLEVGAGTWKLALTCCSTLRQGDSNRPQNRRENSPDAKNGSAGDAMVTMMVNARPVSSTSSRMSSA